jgi:hypothetical protein
MPRRPADSPPPGVLKAVVVLVGSAVLGAVGALSVCGLAAGVLFLRRRSGKPLGRLDVLVLGLCGLAVVLGLLLSTRYLLMPEGLYEVTPPGTQAVLGTFFGALVGGLVLWALRRPPP